MLARAGHIFISVIQKHQFESWPFFRLKIPGDDPAAAKYWKILRREVRVETVLRGSETRKVVDVYEIFWTGGTTGDWNSTQDGERALFLVRVENGRYHVVRDWWRSIFPVTSGLHLRLPLDESRSLWERIALMNWWIERGDESARITYPYFRNSDPGMALSQWRTVNLRGLVRHPSPGVRVLACRDLLELGSWGQDECWEKLSERDRTHLFDGGHRCCSADDIVAARRELQEQNASWWWPRYTGREERRLLTAVNNLKLRTEICRLYEREYPGDKDTGCPADQQPPATIVTERGDVPLMGEWPRSGSPGLFHARLRVSARAAIATSARSASLTDFESGKTFTNSGARSITLVPRRYLSAYLPLTPPEKSYSAFMSRVLRLEGGFFIVTSLTLRRQACTDQADSFFSNSMNHNQQPSLVGHTEGHKPLFVDCVV